MENHHLRCSAAAPRETLADIMPPQEDQENINPTAATAALQGKQLALLGEIVTMIHQTTTRDTHRNHVVHRTLAQQMNEFYYADQQQLQQMTNTLGAIITEQHQMNEQLQARQQASRPVRIYRTPISRRTLKTRHNLAGASVWTGNILSRTLRDRLLGTGPVPLSPLSPCGPSSFPLPQPRSSCALRRLDRSPPYRSGSDIPDRCPV